MAPPAIGLLVEQDTAVHDSPTANIVAKIQALDMMLFPDGRLAETASCTFLIFDQEQFRSNNFERR